MCLYWEFFLNFVIIDLDKLFIYKGVVFVIYFIRVRINMMDVRDINFLFKDIYVYEVMVNVY